MMKKLLNITMLALLMPATSFATNSYTCPLPSQIVVTPGGLGGCTPDEDYKWTYTDSAGHVFYSPLCVPAGVGDFEGVGLYIPPLGGEKGSYIGCRYWGPGPGSKIAYLFNIFSDSSDCHFKYTSGVPVIGSDPSKGLDCTPPNNCEIECS